MTCCLAFEGNLPFLTHYSPHSTPPPPAAATHARTHAHIHTQARVLSRAPFFSCPSHSLHTHIIVIASIVVDTRSLFVGAAEGKADDTAPAPAPAATNGITKVALVKEAPDLTPAMLAKRQERALKKAAS